MSEPALYDAGNVLVTPTRLVVGGRTYPVAGITSVHVEARPGWGPVLLSVLAVIFAGSLFGDPGIVTFAIAAVVGYVVHQRTQRHAVCLNTAGRDVTAFETRDFETADDIVEALNEAVVARG